MEYPMTVPEERTSYDSDRDTNIAPNNNSSKASANGIRMSQDENRFQTAISAWRSTSDRMCNLQSAY